MDFDRSEHEPEEHDPEADFRDPDSDGLTIPRVEPPEVDVPAVDVPEVETSPSEIPSELRRGFWSLVLVLNVAVLVLALAPMLLYFWGSLYHAGVLLIGGLALLGLAYRRYRMLRSMELDAWTDDASGDERGPDPAEDRPPADS